MSLEITPIANEFIEQLDTERFEAWFLEAAHGFVVMRPMSLEHNTKGIQHGMCYACGELSFPTCKGWLWRANGSAIYITVIPVVSAEEKKQREVVFKEKLKPYITGFDQIWDKYKAEFTGYYQRFDPVQVDKLSDTELILHLREILGLEYRCWEVHFLCLYASQLVFQLFEQMCQELLGIDDSNPVFHKLMRGYDTKSWEGDRELWKLAQKAWQNGVGNTFLDTPATGIASKMEGTESGRKWLSDLHQFLKVFGWRLDRTAFWESLSWQEDVSFPIERIKQYVALGAGQTFSMDERRGDMVKEREKAEKEFIAKVPADQREWFRTLLTAAQRTGPFSEDHGFYLEGHTEALTRRAVLEWGKRFVRAGVIDERDDIFFLTADELQKFAWAMERYNLRPLVEQRKKKWEADCKRAYPLIISKLTLPEVFQWMAGTGDPIALKVVLGRFPVPRPELKADLLGVSGAPGQAEGTAKVILSADHMGELQKGDILVTSGTNPSWTPIFAIIGGVVADGGGSLCHAAIASREYGIPCVLNTLEGSQKIKTGQRVKVDGDLGAVYILK